MCEPLAFLGLYLDPAAKSANHTTLYAAGSSPILLIAADEEFVIRGLVMAAMPPAGMCAT